MCTLSVAFYPRTPRPFTIVANRDENPERPSEPWGWRNFGAINGYMGGAGEMVRIFSPLDVLGGTWIGVNDRGMFCAITNWDIDLDWERPAEGFISRGYFVNDTLRCTSVSNAKNMWNKLDHKKYKPFNAIFGWVSKEGYTSAWSITNDTQSIVCKRLNAGLHISTGEGLNVSTNERDKYIRKSIRFESWEQPIDVDDLKGVLKSHHMGIGDDRSVCQHDESHKWETRSQSSIIIMQSTILVGHVDGHPCEAQEKDWTHESLSDGR